jgi:hypothetical protein
MTAITLDERALEYARQLEYRTAAPGPLDYLARHGITDRGVMQRYALGCVMKPLPDDERFRGYISIPYLSRRDVVSIKYRCALRHDCHAVGNGHAKYGKYQGPVKLYNTAAFFEATDIIGIAEGEVDAIAATELLGVPTIGVPGAQAWTAHSKIWQLPLKDYDRIIIFADGDEAGLSCARTIAADVGDRHRIVKCDAGEDVSSMVVKGHAERLKRMAGISSSD